MFSTSVTDTGQITLPDEIRHHLKLVSGSRVEFVISDYLIGAVSRQAGCTETVSFDGKLKGERGFQCLE